MSGRRTQDERRDAARTAILDAAIALLAGGGYVSMTLADVGERAGYSRSLATHYFGSKPRLIAAVVEHIVARGAGGGVSADASARGLERVRAEVASVLGGLRRHPEAMRAYHAIAHHASTNVPEILPAIHHQNQAFRELLRVALNEGVQLGELSPGLDTEGSAMALTAMLRGVVWEWFTDPGLDLDAAERAVSQQVDGWRITPG